MFLWISSVIIVSMASVTTSMSDNILKNLLTIPLNTTCELEVNLTSCDQYKLQFEETLEKKGFTSIIIDRNCCDYRLYIDCLNESLQRTGCTPNVFNQIKDEINTNLYDFESKCHPKYQKNSYIVLHLCGKPEWFWITIAIGLHFSFILTAVWLYFCLTKDRYVFVDF